MAKNSIKRRKEVKVDEPTELRKNNAKRTCKRLSQISDGKSASPVAKNSKRMRHKTKTRKVSNVGLTSGKVMM